MSSSTSVVRSCKVGHHTHIQDLIADICADYFTKVLEDDLKAIVKPQYVDRIPKAIRGPDKTVRHLIEGNASMDNMQEVLDVLGTYLAKDTLQHAH